MLQHLTGPVWLWPADPDPDRIQATVGIVAGDTGSIAVDAGHSPALAGRVRAGVEAAGLPPVVRGGPDAPSLGPHLGSRGLGRSGDGTPPLCRGDGR
ncbi:hypothetical protein [Jiangella sp. DSM 45060]|uniref:hypothetical protein n=1 Tax=Jiangella sp. DSM 45060 TaxID=1798224 RepID=UPI0018D41658|nr:hypothetical protein [Jiangella sp. DSM 45060]